MAGARPLQSPAEYAAKCSHVTDAKRKVFCGMVNTNSNEAGVGEVQARYCLAALTGRIPMPSAAEVENPEGWSCSARLTEYSGLIADLLISRMVNIYYAILISRRRLFVELHSRIFDNS